MHGRVNVGIPQEMCRTSTPVGSFQEPEGRGEHLSFGGLPGPGSLQPACSSPAHAILAFTLAPGELCEVVDC